VFPNSQQILIVEITEREILNLENFLNYKSFCTFLDILFTFLMIMSDHINKQSFLFDKVIRKVSEVFYKEGPYNNKFVVKLIYCIKNIG
jgi:hypothetical protein